MGTHIKNDRVILLGALKPRGCVEVSLLSCIHDAGFVHSSSETPQLCANTGEKLSQHTKELICKVVGRSVGSGAAGGVSSGRTSS